MKITVNRIRSDHDATISTVWIDDKFECFGLEDEPRIMKIAGETRIPAGEYKVKVRAEGGFHNRYNAKFPGFHKGMLQVADVPNFEYILIHIGNTDEDTAGCLLVGTNGHMDNSLYVTASRIAYIELYTKVINFALSGDLTIEYKDLD